MGLLLFGLTGGLASGKSIVAAQFRARGVPVIDADQLAREVVLPGTDGLDALVAAFGRGILLDDGSLNRVALAEIVFADPEKRRILNGIVHPRIGVLTAARASALAARGEPLACYEAALLVENRLADVFRPLVVVRVPETIQIARAMSRDGATEEQARARIQAQMSLGEKVAVADYVIDNSGSREQLVRRADEVLDAIRKGALSP